MSGMMNRHHFNSYYSSSQEFSVSEVESVEHPSSSCLCQCFSVPHHCSLHYKYTQALPVVEYNTIEQSGAVFIRCYHGKPEDGTLPLLFGLHIPWRVSVVSPVRERVRWVAILKALWVVILSVTACNLLQLPFECVEHCVYMRVHMCVLDLSL